MEVIILNVASHEFPHRWESILNNIIERLKNSDKFQEIYGGLIALKNLIENFEWLHDKDREPLEVLTTNLFPLLESFSQNILSNYPQSLLTTFYWAKKYFVL